MASRNRVVRNRIAPIIIATFAGSLVACAPRVGKRGVKHSTPSTARTTTPRTPAKKATPVKRASVAKARPTPVVAKSAPKPIVKLTPQPTADEGYGYSAAPVASPPATPRAAQAPDAKRPAKVEKRDNYYAFSDAEIGALKRRSRPFKRTHARYEVCSRSASKKIARRDAIPEDIARIRIEGMTPSRQRQVDALRAEQKRLDQQQREEMGRCKDLEDQLTELLVQFYRDKKLAAR